MAWKRSGMIGTILMAWIAWPAFAGGKFAPPEGCKVYVTVQMRSCQVSQHYRCGAEPEGHQWAVYSDGEGPYFMSQTDVESRWVDSIDLFIGERDRLISESDPASFTTLISGGRDDFDFKTESDRGEVRRYVGHDVLTGEKVTIDGVELERTKFDLTAMAEDGTMIWRRQGQQLINRDWRLFFGDREIFENSDGEQSENVDTPVQFAAPGEPGYLDNTPAYDCDVVTAQAMPLAERSGS
ncbi:MAG: hypothetical protein WBO29_09215 [Albidovulum sp.]